MDFREVLDLKTETFVRNFTTDYSNIKDIATSDCNDYLPIYALLKHNLISVEEVLEGETKKTKKVILEYSKEKVHTHLNSVRSYNDLIQGLITTNSPKFYTFKLGDVSHRVIFERGLLRDAFGDILICMSIESDYAINTPYETIKSTPDPTKFILYITNKFREPQYKNLKKKLETEYIEKVRAVGLDIVETSYIDKRIYSNNVEPIKFKTLMEMKKYLKEEVPKSLLL